MSENPTWATLAIVGHNESSGYLVETIFINESECSLSGAWSFASLELSEFANVISNRLIIDLTPRGKYQINYSQYSSKEVNLNSFIADALDQAQFCQAKFEEYLFRNLADYKEYMAVPPKDRKLLPKVVKKKLEPMYLHNWLFNVDLEEPEKTLETMGKRAIINGTPSEMRQIIQCAWLVKTLIDNWLQDEVERVSRKYLDNSFKELKILPKTWAEALKSIQN